LYNKMPWPPAQTSATPTQPVASPATQQAVSPANMNMMGTMPAANMPIANMPSANMPSAALPVTTFVPPVTAGSMVSPMGTVFAPPPREESYVENILRMNLGKVATLYMTYENNSEWNAKVFKGVLEAAGRDHIIISDPVTGKRFLLLTLNLDYITFDEPLNYNLPFGTGQAARR
jgi:spore coat protein GerQ